MAAKIGVYLTPEEAQSGTTRMIRPAGGDWVEVLIPPTRDTEVLLLPTDHGEVRVRVTVVPPGLSGADEAPARFSAARVAIILLVVVIALAVVLVLVRGCAAGTTALPTTGVPVLGRG